MGSNQWNVSFNVDSLSSAPLSLVPFARLRCCCSETGSTCNLELNPQRNHSRTHAHSPGEHLMTDCQLSLSSPGRKLNTLATLRDVYHCVTSFPSSLKIFLSCFSPNGRLLVFAQLKLLLSCEVCGELSAASAHPATRSMSRTSLGSQICKRYFVARHSWARKSCGTSQRHQTQTRLKEKSLTKTTIFYVFKV